MNKDVAFLVLSLLLYWNEMIVYQMPFDLPVQTPVQIPVQLLLELEANLLNQNVNELEF